MAGMMDFGHTPILVETVARWLHGQFCHLPKLTHVYEDCPTEDKYYWPRTAGFLIATALPKMGELFEVVRADERAKIAYHIRAELVCCDIFERIEASGEDAETYQLFTTGNDYHAMCHYGGWAASLAEEGRSR